jgi:hypothetical protein
MLGMPITPTIFSVIALMLAGLIALPALAQPKQVIIRRATQLADDDAVKKLVYPYRLLTTANIIYEKCATELAITDPQKQYVAKLMTDTSAAYMQALDAAYRSRTGVSSPREMVSEYQQYILAQQRDASQEAVIIVRNNGCTEKQITDVVKYYNTLQANELAATAASPFAVPTTPAGVAPEPSPTQPMFVPIEKSTTPSPSGS